MSDDMKERPTLSSMGEIETMYEGGWSNDIHRIRSSQEVDASGEWWKQDRRGDGSTTR
jgi:hypothetical protein